MCLTLLRRSLGIALIVAVTGCQTLTCFSEKCEERSTDRIIGQIQIAEGFLQGQRLDIPATGLSLDEAIQMARRPGSFTGVFAGDAEEVPTTSDLWVEWQRGPTRIFLPLFLIQNSMAGSIQLTPGDRLDVGQTRIVGYLPGLTESADIRLRPDTYDSAGQQRGTFTITGTHPYVGQHDITAQVGGKPLRALSVLESQSQINISVALLTRRTGPLTDQYVVPLHAVENFGVYSSLASEVQLKVGDTVSFTRLELLDVVFSSARQAQRGREAVRRERRSRSESCQMHRADGENKTADWSQRLHDTLDSVRTCFADQLEEGDCPSFVPL